jgi:hypothetical protein
MYLKSMSALFLFPCFKPTNIITDLCIDCTLRNKYSSLNDEDAQDKRQQLSEQLFSDQSQASTSQTNQSQATGTVKSKKGVVAVGGGALLGATPRRRRHR